MNSILAEFCEKNIYLIDHSLFFYWKIKWHHHGRGQLHLNKKESTSLSNIFRRDISIDNLKAIQAKTLSNVTLMYHLMLSNEDFVIKL